MDVEPVVFLVCGKSKTRRQLVARLKKLGLNAEAYACDEDFIELSSPSDPGCILRHLSAADTDFGWLKEAGTGDCRWPTVVLAADADVETAVRAMKFGAFDFVLESCSDRRLATAIDEAFRWDALCRRQTATVQSIRRRMRRLAPPLRNVLELLMKGWSNREIAEELSVSQRTVEDRRAKLMRSMRARSVIALVRQVLLAEGVTVSRAALSTEEDRPLRQRSHSVAGRSRSEKPDSDYDPAAGHRQDDRQPKRAR